MSSNEEIPEHILKSKQIETFHELHDSWTFYYLIPDKINSEKLDWTNFLKTLHHFRTFEDFWAIINSIEPVSDLQKGCRYYIFKKNIKPLWEDVNNTGGREISVQYRLQQLPREQRGNKNKNKNKITEIDSMNKAVAELAQIKWINLTVAVLCNKADYFANKNLINGIELNWRNKAIKVGIWTSKATDDEFESLKRDLLAILEFGNNPDKEEFSSEIIVLEQEKESMRQKKLPQ